jgi:hypothetical protein
MTLVRLLYCPNSESLRTIAGNEPPSTTTYISYSYSYSYSESFDIIITRALVGYRSGTQVVRKWYASGTGVVLQRGYKAI